MIAEHQLLDVPIAICPFFAEDKSMAKIPSLAVASGPFIFIYRQDCAAK